MKQALILAGGKGTRLRSRLGNLPKPLVDICGRPLLAYQLELLSKFGFEDVLILVNHEAHKIEHYLNTHFIPGLIATCIDDGSPRGTAGAVLNIFDRLADEFTVLYGDTMLNVDLDRMKAFHETQPLADATILLHPNDHPADSDLVEIAENHLVTRFHPKPRPVDQYYPNLVNAALYIIRKTSLTEWKDTEQPLDFGRDLFPSFLKTGKLIKGYQSPEYIKDCGTPERLDLITEHVRSKRVKRNSLTQKQSAVFLDRDGVINEDIPFISSTRDFHLLPEVASSIKKLNQLEYKVAVITNQPVLARGECSLKDLTDIHNKMETLLGQEGAYLDRIYYCPHHPDKGFKGEVSNLKIKCNCRKPNIGMIEKAIHDLNIDPTTSWFIGDSTVDMETAKRANIRSILVQTGQAGKDNKFNATPDVKAPNLKSAVAYIAKQHESISHERHFISL